MPGRLRRMPTFANVASALALFFAIGGVGGVDCQVSVFGIG
jgi:hypothetical protein